MTASEKIIQAEIVSGSCAGASHLQGGMPCQDSLSVRRGTYRGDPCVISIVADGHGGKRHCFSDLGSALATVAGEQVTLEFLMSNNLSAEAFASHVQRKVKVAWIESIRKVSNQFAPDIETIRKYGSTLLISLLYGDQVYLAQLGDGEIFYFDKQGAPVFLVEPESGPLNPATDSLCSTSADTCWKIRCVPLEDVSFLMLSTDGLINAFAETEDYVKFARTLRDVLETQGPSQINAELPNCLSEYSSQGAVGDDISLIAVNLTPNLSTKGEDDV